MKAKVGARTWRMSRGEYERLLKVASEQVPFGIYAVEKAGYAELCTDHCQSSTKLKQLTQQYRQQGFKVRANGR